MTEREGFAREALFFQRAMLPLWLRWQVANPEMCRTGAKALDNATANPAWRQVRFRQGCGRRAHCIPPGTGSYWPSPRIRGRLANARRIGQDWPDFAMKTGQ